MMHLLSCVSGLFSCLLFVIRCSLPDHLGTRPLPEDGTNEEVVKIVYVFDLVNIKFTYKVNPLMSLSLSLSLSL